jgi:integrase
MKPYYKKSHAAYYVNYDGRQIRLGRTEDEANAKFKELPPLQIKPSNDLEILVQRFLAHYRKPTTRKFYENHLKLLLKLPVTKANRLRAHHLTDILDRFEGNYKHNIAKAAKTCFKWLAEKGYIKHSPFTTVKMPPVISRGDEAYVPDAEQAVAKAQGDLFDILTVIRETGCRPQEARRMEAKHLHDNCIVFPKIDSKGNRRQRVVHLTNRALEILRRQLEKHPTGPLLRNQGKFWTGRALSDKCGKLGFTAYQLRHTFATNAILKGIDLVTIATLMGHSNLKMLTQVYQHVKLFDSHLQDALQKVNT